ncbi:hypothetical protein ILUMI_22370 [Ignelater luminosus]|uniref:B30.2/SPRY domain-containing protein n=1 Tax=Ignelater luminosus TaxID=2038154 RepID=A0A8K0G2V3_IGNLU|nr:hypothetical protein ILUMI_22370 [Ignelater luminosus]
MATTLRRGDDCSPNIIIQGDDEFIFTKDLDGISTDCVRGRVGIQNGIHAWKIYWNAASRDPYSIIGVATKDTPLHSDEVGVLVGGDNCSWGWDVQSTMLYHNSHPDQGAIYPQFMEHSVRLVVPNEIAMLLNMNEGTLSYYVKGCYLGVAFKGLAGLKLYPIINVTSQHTQVRMEYLGSLP